ncbi:MAG: bifunctional phosphopantothenoylcysteine decarboxylase/phosphopantothenate--cysteine ligase CoaBC [Gammaproteobacteria bacterium]|nr:bifunctional phosphopantothenoylcysteine decarboxylase/phosphopantothenate--cysteine ligase CoaBC [Gammaproteobacteria bacterium]
MKVLIGVTGGIAAYKSLELTRLFIKAGDEVQVVMTEGAKAFIQPLSFQALSGNPVRDSLFDANQEAGMGHIELARWADQIVIAPATAETLAKLRMGRADDLLTTLCLATDKPILIAPAMNRLMWHNAATQENVQILKSRGFTVLSPGEGEQACGDVGAGRMPEPHEILNAVTEFQTHQKANNQAWLSAQTEITPFWQGKKVLITAGPTFEDIDPVRFIGNRSSGKMGFAIAEAAAKLGAEVTLIAGPVQLVTPLNVKRIEVRSAQQMLTAVQSEIAGVDTFVGAAAVADFRVEHLAEHKIKKQADSEALTLTLVKNPDIIAWVAAQNTPQDSAQDSAQSATQIGVSDTAKTYVVGFAAETQNVVAYAQEKRQRKQLDMIAANQVGVGAVGFESNDNALTLISAKETVVLPQQSKQALALALLTFIKQQRS